MLGKYCCQISGQVSKLQCRNKLKNNTGSSDACWSKSVVVTFNVNKIKTDIFEPFVLVLVC